MVSGIVRARTRGHTRGWQHSITAAAAACIENIDSPGDELELFRKIVERTSAAEKRNRRDFCL